VRADELELLAMAAVEGLMTEAGMREAGDVELLNETGCRRGVARSTGEVRRRGGSGNGGRSEASCGRASGRRAPGDGLIVSRGGEVSMSEGAATRAEGRRVEPRPTAPKTDGQQQQRRFRVLARRQTARPLGLRGRARGLLPTKEGPLMYDRTQPTAFESRQYGCESHACRCSAPT
jgi:hypothetical protein